MTPTAPCSRCDAIAPVVSDAVPQPVAAAFLDVPRAHMTARGCAIGCLLALLWWLAIGALIVLVWSLFPGWAR